MYSIYTSIYILQYTAYVYADDTAIHFTADNNIEITFLIKKNLNKNRKIV